MNINSIGTRYQRLDSNSLKNRNNEPAVFFDNTERRMEHTSFQTPNILQEFWSLTSNMPRTDQLSLAATALASQAGQNGLNETTKPFLSDLKQRFTPAELESLEKMVKNQPSLKGKSTAQIDAFWDQIKQVWADLDSQKTTDEPLKATETPAKTPEEIYFHTTLNTIKRIDQALTL